MGVFSGNGHSSFSDRVWQRCLVQSGKFLGLGGGKRPTCNLAAASNFQRKRCSVKNSGHDRQTLNPELYCKARQICDA